jgi:SH3-like domain-containing protein
MTAIPTVKPVMTEQWTASVQLPVVNVRDAPNGKVIGSLVAGDSVVIVKCVGSWCQIKPAGWIFRGCLSDNPANLGCTAK